MKKWIMAMIVFVIAIALIFIVRFGFGGDEDDWIRDDRGVWVMHGNPSETPTYVTAQQSAIDSALEMYYDAKSNGMEFNSQCLGTSGDYAVDIVHVPRTDEDNLVENQCEAFRNGEAHSFIELDEKGIIVRIIDKDIIKTN
jgi:hypothetical protein